MFKTVNACTLDSRTGSIQNALSLYVFYSNWKMVFEFIGNCDSGIICSCNEYVMLYVILF